MRCKRRLREAFLAIWASSAILHLKLKPKICLNERLRYEAEVSSASTALLSNDDDAIEKALRHLMAAADVGRVSILQGGVKPDGQPYYEVTNMVDADESIDTSQFLNEYLLTPLLSKYVENLQRNQQAVLRASDAPKELQGVFERRNIKSILFLPIQVETRLVGLLLFIDLVNERTWDHENVNLLHAAASMLGTYLARREAQVELKKQQIFLRQVIDLNPEYIFVKDVNGRYTLVNQAFAQRYNRLPQDFIGQTDEDLGLLSPDKAKRFHQADQAIMQSNEEVSLVEDHVQLEDGSDRWLQTYKRPIINEEGEATNLLAISVDVTQQREALEFVQERENLLQSILDTLPGALYWKDKNLVFQGGNNEFARTLGLTPAQLTGKTEDDVGWFGNAEANKAEDAEILATQVPILAQAEQRIYEDDKLWIEKTKIVLVDNEGNVDGLIGYYRDISERMSLQHQVQDMLEIRSRPS